MKEFMKWGVQSLNKNPILTVAVIVLSVFFHYTTVSTSDLKEIVQQQHALEGKVDTIIGELKGLALSMSDGKEDSFNHYVKKFPPGKYVFGVAVMPPTPEGYDSCVIMNQRPGEKRPLVICYYTTPGDTAATVTEFK